MQHAFKISLLLVLLLSCRQPVHTPPAIPISEMEEADVGVLDAGEGPYTFRFSLRNPYADILYPEGIELECACTSVSREGLPVAPGAEEVLIVRFDPANENGGFRQEIKLLYSPESPTRERILAFRGEVVPLDESGF